MVSLFPTVALVDHRGVVCSACALLISEDADLKQSDGIPRKMVLDEDSGFVLENRRAEEDDFGCDLLGVGGADTTVPSLIDMLMKPVV